jgi:hypothetical protein
MFSKIFKEQKGIAMALSLMVILTLTVLVSGMMFSVVNDKVITANHVRDAQALAVSKAGTAEVMRRIGYGYRANNDTSIIQDLAGINGNWQCLIFLSPPGTGPSAISFKRSLQNADTLQYSVPYNAFAASGDTSQVLRVRYKTWDTNNDGVITVDEIYFYDYLRKQITLGRVYPTPGDAYPVWQIIAPARVGNARRALVTEVVIPRLNVLTQAGLSADGRVWGTGAAKVCGHNHLYTTPVLDPPACFDAWHVASGDSHGLSVNNFASASPKTSCNSVGCVFGIETMDTLENSGANKKAWGNPDSTSASTRPTLAIWEMLGMSQAQCMALDWTTADPVVGFTHFIANKHFTGNTSHEGVLWVEGDVMMAGTVDFRGLIYIEGDLQLSGTLWVLGGIVVHGAVQQTNIHGNMTVLYSSEAIARAIQRAQGTNMRIWSQREM